MELFKELPKEEYKEHHQYFERVWVHPKGHLEIYLYRVLYGWRIQSAFSKDWQFLRLDWCCGSDQNCIIETQWKMMVILIAFADDENPYKGLPNCSKIKPHPLDHEFTKLINNKFNEALKIIEKNEIQ